MTADHVTEARPVGPADQPAAHRAVCSCGWQGQLHYSADHLARAISDAAGHVEAVDFADEARVAVEGDRAQIAAMLRRAAGPEYAQALDDLGEALGVDETIAATVCTCEVSPKDEHDLIDVDLACPKHGYRANPELWAAMPGSIELEPGGETLDDYRRRQVGSAPVWLVLLLALVASFALAAPALAKAPTRHEVEVAAATTNRTLATLRSSCINESNAPCINRTLWKESTAVVVLLGSVDAGTSSMCPGMQAHRDAASRYIAALLASGRAPRSLVAATRSLHARRAWIAALNRLSRCASFRWAS